MALSPIDIAWMSGILEGEGCFMERKRRVADKTYRSIYIQLVMTDKDVMQKVANMWNAPLRDMPWRGLMTKPTYRVQIHGDKAASWMMTIYGFMGERRRNKIAQCIALWKASPGKTKRQIATRHMRMENSYVPA